LRRPRFQIRTFVITINLIVLALPLAGIAGLRIVENLLHRQTEAKLASEAAYIKALYVDFLNQAFEGDTLSHPYVIEVEELPKVYENKWQPYLPQIDLSKQDVLPPPDESKLAANKSDPPHLEAGKKIEPLLKSAQRHTLSGIRVLDQRGVVVASTAQQHGHDLSSRYEVKEALSGRYCSVLRAKAILPSEEDKYKWGDLTRASRVRIFLAVPMIEDDHLVGVVYLSRTSLSFFRDMWERRYGTTLLLIVSATILISLTLAWIVTKPFKRLASQSQLIASGEKEVSIEVGGMAPTEAAQLAVSLESMVERMAQRLKYVQEFARSVSHEFKTPLASTRAAIELLKDGWEDMTDEERSRFFSIIEHDSKRMDRLVKKLLELARIETMEAEDAETDLVEVVEHVVHRFRESGASIEVVKASKPETAKISPDMAETLLYNLVENAITHGRGTGVKVVLEKGPKLTVRDKGPGITSANLNKIFDRFFTTNRDNGGTGLGLSMVKAIADANEAEICVTSDVKGSEFTVLFKRKRKAG
jgi:signal transduction histidine kinase